MHGKLILSSGLSWANPRPGAEPTSPAFVSLEQASYSGPVGSSLACEGYGGAQGSSLLVAEAQMLSSGRFLSPPACPDPPKAQRFPQTHRPASCRPEVAFPGGHRLGKAGRRRGAAVRPPGAAGALRGSSGLRSPELTNFTRRDTACARGVPHPRLGAHPSHALPSPFARSDPAACVFPGGGRQTAGHCVIHVPRSPMCVAVCVTDGAPGEYEGRGVNFLLKGPNTCVRSFLYYFGETRGGGQHDSLYVSGLGSRMGFALTPALPRPSGIGSLQLPCPRPSDERHTLHLH